MLLAAQIVSFALIAPALLRLSPDRLGQLLKLCEPGAGGSSARVEHLARVIDTTLDFGRPVVRRGCLVKGLTRYVFLRRAGAPVSMCFGIALESRVGHCWLEMNGVPFLEVTDPRSMFLEMFRFPRRD